jgi:hypothetical protein
MHPHESSRYPSSANDSNQAVILKLSTVLLKSCGILKSDFYFLTVS